MDLLPHEIEVLESVGLDGHCLGTIDTNEKFAVAMKFASISDKGFLDAVIGDRGATYFLTTRGAMALEGARP
jgi:hypothetical protein